MVKASGSQRYFVGVVAEVGDCRSGSAAWPSLKQVRKEQANNNSRDLLSLTPCSDESLISVTHSSVCSSLYLLVDILH
jgi:hypothetical protein